MVRGVKADVDGGACAPPCLTAEVWAPNEGPVVTG